MYAIIRESNDARTVIDINVNADEEIYKMFPITRKENGKIPKNHPSDFTSGASSRVTVTRL